MSKLSETQIAIYLRKLPGWKYEGNAIEKQFSFNQFEEAIQFVNAVADKAKEANHHPDLFIQSNKVRITLTTHDRGGVTGKDFLLAEQIDQCI